MRGFTTVLAVGLAMAVGGCDDLTNLDVVNENNPDTERALANAADVEALIGAAFLSWWQGTQLEEPAMGLSVTADEMTGSWGNFCMQDCSSEPRVAYDNTPAYSYAVFNEDPWQSMYGALSSAFDGISAIDGGLEIGPNGADNPRALAFARFMQGIAHGFLAMFFDKGFLFDETVDFEALQGGGSLDFSSYTDLGNAALGYLDQSIAIADQNSFTTPAAGWINGVTLSNTELSQLAHSYRARIMTAVSRTPAERDAVDWNSVLSHINAGITQDFVPLGDGNFWWDAMKFYGQDHIWNRADYKTIGWTDTSGEYAAWLATPVADRQPFEIETVDTRVTAAGDPEGDGTYFTWEGQPLHRPDRGTYHFSFYAHSRYQAFSDAGAVGPMPAMLVSEMDMLAAEAYIRLGQLDNAVTLINQYRVPAGLTAVAATDGADALMEAMIYEKRIETFVVASGLAFFDRRGWGPPSPTNVHHRGLVEGTPHHYPVPGTELEVLQLPLYTIGGPGNEFGPSGSPGIPVGPTGSARIPLKAVYVFEPGWSARDKYTYLMQRNRALRDGVTSLTRYE